MLHDRNSLRQPPLEEQSEHRVAMKTNKRMKDLPLLSAIGFTGKHCTVEVERHYGLKDSSSSFRERHLQVYLYSYR